MRRRTISLCLLLVSLNTFCLSVADDKREPFDPLRHVSNSFPDAISIADKPPLIEFCPDNTCDGFLASREVVLPELRDFAYLYIYFFSDFYVLQDWRAEQESQRMAERVLSKAEYQRCTSENRTEMARCVLLHLSRGGRIRLLSVRYDEGKRTATFKNVNAVILNASAESGQAKPNARPETLTLCELFAEPIRFDGKLVEVQATLRYGEEWNELYCLTCKDEYWVWLESIGDFEEAEKQWSKIRAGTVNVRVLGVFRAGPPLYGTTGRPHKIEVTSIKKVRVVSRIGVLPHALTEKERQRVCHCQQ